MRNLGSTLLWTSVLCLVASPASWAQDSSTQVTLEALQSRIAAVQDSDQLDEASKTRLVDLYRESISNLQTASANRADFEGYRRALRTAPVEAQRLIARNELRRQTDPVAGLDVSPAARLTALISQLNEEVADQTVAEANLAVLEARLESDEARPSEAREQIAAARSRIEELSGQINERSSGEQSPQLVEATRWVAQTRLEALRSEIGMLDEELLSYSVRSDLLKAQRDDAALTLSRANARVDALRGAVTEGRRLEAERILAEAQVTLEGPLANERPVRELAQANLALVQRLQDQVTESDEIATRERRRPRASQIDAALRNARRRLDLAGAGTPMGAAILEERQQFPSAHEYAVERRAIGRSMTTVSARLLEAEEERRTLNDIAGYVESRIAAAGDMPLTDEAQMKLRSLAETRRSLLDRAIETDRALQQRLYALDDAIQRLANGTRVYDEYLTEHLLWVRSTRPIDASVFVEFRDELVSYLSPARWIEVAGLVARRLIEAPVFAVVLLTGFVVAGRRKRLRNALAESGATVGHLRYDSMTKTFEAIVYTLLLAAPAPIVLAALGGALATAPEASDFASGVGFALLKTGAWLAFWLTVHVLLRPDGLGERHFGWHGPTLKSIRRQIGWFLAVAFPAYFLMLTAATLENQPSRAVPALMMFAFSILMLSLLALAVGLAHPRTGQLHRLLALHPSSRWWRWRYLWVTAVILAPIVLLALAALGFAYTVQQLTPRLFLSIGLVSAVWLGGALVRRALLVTGRRLAHREWMAAQTPTEPGRDSAVAAEEVDLVALGSDSSKLLNAAILAAVVLGLVGIWGRMVPALGIFNEFSLWNGTVVVDGVTESVPVTLANLLIAMAVAVGGYIVAARLPSLVDIILLKQGSVSAGGRYTVETLTRYSVTAITVLLALSQLGVNASQLGWAAAALGVGIGFGLQEIVANFICGLILLFERPIRVGDVITVGAASGVVTKIRIRATTILDWEHKELVVPNKELITSRLLNWSLSDSVTRLMITIGVAYGSDVERAMQLILEAAKENVNVLSDPPPSVHFDRFGESSLNLMLRACVGQLSERLQATTDLHKAIDKKFREAGIVIAFPQRDVHVYARDASAAARGIGELADAPPGAGVLHGESGNS